MTIKSSILLYTQPVIFNSWQNICPAGFVCCVHPCSWAMTRALPTVAELLPKQRHVRKPSRCPMDISEKTYLNNCLADHVAVWLFHMFYPDHQLGLQKTEIVILHTTTLL